MPDLSVAFPCGQVGMSVNLSWDKDFIEGYPDNEIDILDIFLISRRKYKLWELIQVPQ